MHLSDYLKKYGLTQAAFAKKADVPKVCISNYLSGKRQGFTLKTSSKIVMASGGEISYEDLLVPGLSPGLEASGGAVQPL
jgi:predicted transcriptional regulator